jgi:hypothetical protein
MYPKSASEVCLECHWQFAFNLKHGKGTVGYLSSWTGLGGLTLSPDIVLWSPTPGANSPLPTTLRTSNGGGTTNDQLKCVGVIEKFTFGGEPTDPIRMSVFISKDNQVKLRSKLTRAIPSTKFKLDYAVVSFDEDAKVWYPAVTLDASPSAAQINTSNGQLQLFAAFEPTRISDALNINVYRMEFEMIAGQSPTRLKLATGPQHRYVTSWQGDD